MQRIDFFKSVIFRWLISYIAIILVSILATSVSYITTYNIVRDQIVQDNQLLMTKMQEETDRVLSDVGRLNINISNDIMVKNVSAFNGDLDNIRRFDILKTSRELQNYVYINSLISNFFIYYWDIDFIVSVDCSADSRSYYSTYYNLSGLTYNQWLGILKNNSASRYFPFPDNNGKDKNVAYIRCIPLTNSGETNTNLVVIVRKTDLLPESESLYQVNGGYTFILDNNNDIVLTSSNTLPKIERNLYDQLKQDSGIIHAKINGQEVMVSYTDSKINKWKYISVIPSQIFWNKLEYTRTIMFASLLFCLIFGGALSTFLVKKNYDPVKRLLNVVGKNGGSSVNNEFFYIESAVARTMKEKREINRKLNQQNRALQADFLARMLKDEIRAKKYMEEYMLTLDINFPFKNFMLILLYIVDVDEELIEENHGDTLIELITENVLSDMLKPECRGFLLEVDGMMACLVNISEEGVNAGICELKARVGMALKFIEENYRITFAVSMSGLHKTLFSIPQVYHEAQQAIEYNLAMSVQGITCYSEIEKQLVHDYYYPLEKEQQLINFIKAGDSENAKAIVDQVLKANFEEKAPSGQTKKIFEYNLMSTLMRTINDLKEIYGCDFSGLIKETENLINYNSASGISQHIHLIVNSLCGQTKVSVNSLQAMDNIKKYIKENYYDVNLSISSIARSLDLHPAYLSQMFKVKSGEGILEYLHKTRINVAKKLLRSDMDMKLDDIALQTGFANTRTFMRVFKKLEGVTPGKYK